MSFFLAERFGYQRFYTDIMVVTMALLILIVQNQGVAVIFSHGYWPARGWLNGVTPAGRDLLIF